MAAMLPHVEHNGTDRDVLAYGTPTADDDIDFQASTESDEGQPPPTKWRRDATMLPAFPYGIIFLQNICVGPQYLVPCLNNEGLTIKPNAFHYFFGVDYDKMEKEFFCAGLVQPANPSRIPNKVRCTTRYHKWDRDDVQKEFSIARHGFSLPSPAHDAGSDVSEEEEEAESQGEGDNIDARLTKIWWHFLIDITLKSPNKKLAGKSSYFLLDMDQCLHATEATYNNCKLSDIFSDCQWKIAEPREWGLIFDRLFPPKNGKPLTGKVQNYKKTQYYPEWVKLRERADDETFSCMRWEVRKKIDMLYWLPFAQTDRIWRTSLDLRFKRSSGKDRLATSPQILLNGNEPEW